MIPFSSFLTAIRRPAAGIAWLAAAGAVPGARAEIHFSLTTSSEVASALVREQPHSLSANGRTLLRALSGPLLTDAAAPGGAMRLVQSSISPVTASPSGHPAFADSSLAAARREIRGEGLPGGPRAPGAAEYRYGLGQNGAEALWDIQFDAVPDFDPARRNFFPDKLASATALARAAIRANPHLTGRGSGYEILFEAAYEETVPYTHAGCEWRALAERERTDEAAQPSIAGRIARLEAAAGCFRRATRPLLRLLNHPVESRYLRDPRPWLGAAAAEWGGNTGLWVKTWDQLLLEAYLEALNRLGQCQVELFHTRYFQDYRHPDEGGFDRAPLLAAIRQAADEIDRLMLPVTALTAGGPVPEAFDTAGPPAEAGRLRRLADHVTQSALTFSAGLNPTNNQFAHGTYGPNDIPFLVPAQLAERPFTFDNFRSFVTGDKSGPEGAMPGTLVDAAKAADAQVRSQIEDVIRTVENLEKIREETRSLYEGQLGQLCGQRRSDASNAASPLVPDLPGCIAPTAARRPLQPGESYGDIALQWSRIDQSETRLLLAFRALAEIDEQAAVIRAYGDERLLSYDRIASIQLESGEKLSALDYLSGEIRARALRREAEAITEIAGRKDWFTALHAVANRTGQGAGAGGVWGAIAGAALGSAQVFQQFSRINEDASIIRGIGAIQAKTTRRQADIAARQTRIRAVEGARITLEQRGQEDNRIREAIQMLLIGVERQQLEILLAEQQRDFAELEHANLLGRISSLVEEYRRVSVRQSKSALNRPDLRPHREYGIQEALRKFRVAQEYAWLMARAADYRFSVRDNAFRTRIAAQTAAILRAQNGKQLETAVSALIDVRAAFLIQTGGMAGIKEVRLSLRDLVAQSNHASAAQARTVNGEWIAGADPALLQPFPSSLLNGQTDPAALSDAHFAGFLRDRLERDPGAPGSSILRLRFAIGYEPMPLSERTDASGQPVPSGRENPLRTAVTDQFGHVIVGAGASYDQNSAVGVFLNIRNRSGVLPSTFPTTASLRPVGVFHTTTARAPSPTGPITGLRAWNPVNMDGGGVSDNSVRILHNADTKPAGWKTRFPALNLEGAGSKLHERSPANDHWLLEIKTDNSTWNQYLPTVSDIEVCMTIRGW